MNGRGVLKRVVASGWPGANGSAVLVVVLALVTSMAVTPARASHDETSGELFRPAVVSAGGVVASMSVQASRVGIDVLNGGGNAIDAAVATVFAVGVTRPEMCGIGGGGFLLYRSADGEDVAALDFRESYPDAADTAPYGEPGMHRPGKTPFSGLAGHMAVGVPGTVAGMAAALERYGSGRFTLAQLIRSDDPTSRLRAEGLARNGMTVTSKFSAFETLFLQRLSYYPETRSIYLVGGAAPYPPGATLVQKEYAESLRLVAKGGVDAFYRGVIGSSIVTDMIGAEKAAETNPAIVAEFGTDPNDIGLLSADDLASYRAVWREPLATSYRGRKVITMPFPAAGAISVVEMLNILENANLGSLGHSSADHVHLLAEAQKLALADRHGHVQFAGDPPPELIRTLTSKRYGRERFGEIDMDQAQSYERGIVPGSPAAPAGKSSQTTHVSVIDGDGNAVAVTCSLGLAFGSGVVAPRTGFLLNAQLVPPDAPRNPDAGLGGERSVSSMTPAIVVHGGRPVLVTGGAGSNSIPMGVLQSMVNVVDFGQDAAHAIDAARVAVKNANSDEAGTLEIEECNFYPVQVCERFHDDVEKELTDRGHDVRTVDDGFGYTFEPVLQSAAINRATGNNEAVSDPREEGGACGQNAPCEHEEKRQAR